MVEWPYARSEYWAASISNSPGRGCQTRNDSRFFFGAGDLHSQLSTVHTKQFLYEYQERIVYTREL